MTLLGEANMHGGNAGPREPRRTARRRARPALIAVVLAAVAVLVPAVSLASTTPRLTASGHHLLWSAAGSSGEYRLLARGPSGSRVTVVSGLSTTPAPTSGATVTYRVKAIPDGSWSNAVSITYPQLETERGPPPPPGTEAMSVGLNAGGWGPAAFSDVAGAAKSVRMESRFANDSEVGGAAAAGVSVRTWLFGTGGTIGKIDPAKYAAEVVSVFRRYGKGGTFWQGRTDLGGDSVEVLNEPGGSWFWTDPTNYAAYTNLLRVVHEALAANFPAAIRPKVLASWDAPNKPFGVGWSAVGGLAYCDGVTVHPYGGSKGEAGGALGNRRSVEEAHALSGKPVFVTEVGWPTAVGQPSTGDSQQWTEAQQAQNITNFVRWARSTGYVAAVDVFGYVDYGTNSLYGIERHDRSHKPSFAALAAA